MASNASPAPKEAVSATLAWLNAVNLANDGLDEKPDDNLLIEAVNLGGIRNLPVENRPARLMPNKTCVLTFAKPDETGEFTEREIDLVSLALVMLLCVPGGEVLIQAKGALKEKYYGRLILPGSRHDGKERSVQMSRILAEAPFDLQVKEPEDFHSWKRVDYGRYLRHQPRDTKGLYGIENAKADAIACFSELITDKAEKSFGLTTEVYRAHLAKAHVAMRSIPLGFNVVTGRR